MKTPTFLFIIGALALTLTACKRNNKDEAPEPEQPQETPYEIPQKFFARSVDYGLQGSFQLEYNTDNTLKQMIPNSPASRALHFEYLNKKVVKAWYGGSNTTYNYSYANNRISKYENRLDNVLMQAMDYTYREDGKLSKTKAYGPPGSDVAEENTTYEYDNEGFLRTVRRTTPNYVYTYKIKAYSDSCSLNPWVLVPPGPSKHSSPIFNYHLLSAMHRLPSHIEWLVKPDGEEEYLVAVEKYDFAITDKKVNSYDYELIYPDLPNRNQFEQVNLNY